MSVLVKVFAQTAIGAMLTLSCLVLLVSVTKSMSAEMTERLFEAALQNNVEQIKEAINSGLPVDLRDGEGRTALLIATRANAVHAARLLISLGADVNAKDHIEDSPFLYAGAEGRLDILKMTVDAGADLGSTNRYGGTALIPAAHHGHVDTVRFLLPEARRETSLPARMPLAPRAFAPSRPTMPT